MASRRRVARKSSKATTKHRRRGRVEPLRRNDSSPDSGVTVGELTTLQQTIGNKRTQALMRESNVVPIENVFGKHKQAPSGAKWRVPPSADLQAMITGGTVSESVVKSRVRRLLDRMNREGRLRVAPPVDVGIVMNEIFPSAGTLDETAYERYIDPADRTMVYHSVRDNQRTPRAADRQDLKRALQQTAADARTVASDQAGLTAVFGAANWRLAASNYRAIAAKLRFLRANVNLQVSSDYNLDAQETGLGGWADFGAQHVHLLSSVVSDPFTPGSKSTLLHEAAHLAKSSIDDHVYYGVSGFESAAEDIKINNAAHYEELPQRVWGSSAYAGQTFTPGSTSRGVETTEEKIRKGGALYYRKAWDAAADFDDLLKSCRKDQLNGLPIDAVTKARLLEVSRLMDLTLHEQPAGTLDISRLDVTTSESVARAMSIAGQLTPNQTGFRRAGVYLTEAAEISAGVSDLVDAAMAAYGGLLGDASRDRQLSNWLESHYRSVFP